MNSTAPSTTPAGDTRAATRGGSRLGHRLTAFLTTCLLMCGLIVVSGGTAHAADPDSHRPATWNMRRSGADNGWARAWQLAQTQDVVALQEVLAAPPAGVFDVTNPRGERNILGVANRDDNILFASAHALSGGGWDVRYMVPAVRARANAVGIRNWALLADFNRDPTATRGIAALNEAHIYNAGGATRESGTELDYMVSNVDTDNWHGTVLPNGVSDHWPVAFRGLRAGGEAQEVTIHPDTPDPVVLDVAGEATGNGSHLITYHRTGGANQRWRITPTGHITNAAAPLNHIVSTQSGKCLDVDRGQSSSGGELMNIWDCHGADGSPTPGGPQRDTQGFVLEHPDPLMPNVTMLRDIGTGFYVDLRRPDEGTMAHQWLRLNSRQFSNELFYLDPVIS